MKTKMFRPSNAEYIVNEDKRTVVCVSHGHSYDVCEYIDKYLMDQHINVNWQDLMISDTFIGIAKCCPEDTWDELIGKRVAYNKMCSQYNGAINNTIAMTAKKLNRAAEIISKMKSNIKANE